MRTAALLLVAETNVDFEWNVVVELPGASFPIDGVAFDMQVREPTPDQALVLRFSTAALDGSITVSAQDAGAQTATLMFLKPQSAIAALEGAYPATFTMTRGNGVSGTLAAGTVKFRRVETGS